MISKHKARRVTIGGTAFRYKVSCTPRSRGIYGLNITVQNESHNGSKLLVTGLISKDHTIWPMSEGDSIHYPTVTRHEVETLVKEAIHQGWDHSAKGRDFTLHASNEIFRLWTPLTLFIHSSRRSHDLIREEEEIFRLLGVDQWEERRSSNHRPDWHYAVGWASNATIQIGGPDDDRLAEYPLSLSLRRPIFRKGTKEVSQEPSEIARLLAAEGFRVFVPSGAWWRSGWTFLGTEYRTREDGRVTSTPLG